jgi:hypothetical protein
MKTPTDEEFINKNMITITKRFLFKKRKQNLSAFVKKNTDDSREVTHRLLDGGNIHLGKEEMEEFYSVYATDIVSGFKNYIVELRTPIFKYFIDLDIFDHEYYTGKSLLRIIVKIQKALSYFTNRSSFNDDVYVCTTPEKRVKKEDIEYIKTGVHLIWPTIYVTQEIALFLRQFIIQFLISKMGPRPDHNDWEDVVDETVYNQNGLRLMGSYKALPCKVCKNKQELRDSCEPCAGLGKLFGDHTYKLAYILSTDNRMKIKACAKIVKKQSEMIKLLSIRSNKFKSNIIIEEPYPPWFNVSFASKANKHINKILKTTRENQKRTGGSTAISIIDSAYVDAVTSIVEQSFGQKAGFRGLGIKSIRKPPDAKEECYWVTTDCCYCLNVGREHGQSTIYFKITYSGVVQKCFCKKNTLNGGREKVCGKFESKKYGVSFKYKEILFPEQYALESKETPAYKVQQEKTLDQLDDPNELKELKQTSMLDFNNEENDLFGMF